MPPPVLDAVVIGGGPAGAAVARLLASWGHSVRLLARPNDRARGLAESLPPSTRKLLAEIGVLDAVDAAGFLPTTGNTSWWDSSSPRIETFETPGYQVFRPDFDALLIASARAAGADVHEATVRRVDGQDVEYDAHGRRECVTCRFVIDCSGRAGVVARRYRCMNDDRTFAYVGVWRRETGWDVPDPTHTLVERFDAGWAWSIPIDPRTRHLGVMVSEAGGSYGSHVARTRELKRLVDGATLERSFTCDASSYSSTTYAGPGFLLAGDAGSFITPLSSFGVKKALASAWLGAIVVHTALVYPERAPIAIDFFSAREREMQAAFPEAESGFSPASVPEGRIEAAFERLRAAPSLNLSRADVPLEDRPVVRGREIVVERALAGGLRFAGNVDLLKLAEMAPRHRQVPDLFDAYCRDCGPVPLPSVVSGLSLLVAKGILYER
jgi:flavin-dependent dehydrogenase